MRWAKFRCNERGFSLSETLVAVGILATVSMGVAQLFGIATRNNQIAKAETSATTLATKKMEQLRSLTWGFDTAGLGLPVSDTTTDLSVDPPGNGGGGLNPTPASSLTSNIAGYFEYLGPDGAWMSNQDGQPGGGVYIRRWSISPLPTNPNNTLILQVFVTSVVRDRTRPANQPVRRLPGDAWLVSVRTRKSQ